MKRLVMLVLGGLAACAQGPSLNHPNAARGPDVDAAGSWEVRRSTDAGISAEMPCKPLLSSSDPQDGYGHQTKYFEMRCIEPLGGTKSAFFRVSRTTYPSSKDLARENFAKYMSLVRSGANVGPTVTIQGQQREIHVDYVLKQRSVRGDLGLHETQDECMWNFMGLDGGSEVQAVMSLPKSMCPTGTQSISTEISSKFFDSILYDAW
jgi:hypothetical protein